MYVYIYIYIIYIYYIDMYIYVCICVCVCGHKWFMIHRVLKSHRSKMNIIYMQSWKQCALPVIITMLSGNSCTGRAHWAHIIYNTYIYICICIYIIYIYIYTYIYIYIYMYMYIYIHMYILYIILCIIF